MQALLADLIEQVKELHASKRSCRIVGGASKDFYGNAYDPSLPELSLSTYTGIVDYEPSELVLVARAGTPLAQINDVLAHERQMLAFEPPVFSSKTTLGGTIATGLSGPRRAYSGSARDFVLGTQVLDGQAQILNFGGKVMKNVAGYDVARLMTGAMGTLGVLLELSLKVVPRPETELTLSLECTQEQALSLCNDWRSQSLSLSATAWLADDDFSMKGRLYIRLSGSEVAVSVAKKTLAYEELSSLAATELWNALATQTHQNYLKPELWRVSLPAACPSFVTPIIGFEWGGCLRWLTQAPSLEQRKQIHALGGHVCAYRVSSEHKPQDVFDLPATATRQIHNNLKRQFDPMCVFNPGRLYSFM